MDIFKCPARTITLLIKTQAIPFLIVDYTRNSIQTLMYRNRMFMLTEATSNKMSEEIQLKIIPVLEQDVDVIIRKSTQMVWDDTVINDEMFYKLLEAITHAHEILRSRMIQINNKKGTGFTESDFDTLVRLGTKARYDKEFWSLEE